VQQALRWLVESAAYDIVAEMDGRHGQCDALVPGLGQAPPEAQVGDGGAFPFLGTKERKNDEEPEPAALRPMPALRRPKPGLPEAAMPAPVPVPVPAPAPEPAVPPAVGLKTSAVTPQEGPWRVVAAGEAADGKFSVRLGLPGDAAPAVLPVPVPAVVAAMEVKPEGATGRAPVVRPVVVASRAVSKPKPGKSTSRLVAAEPPDGKWWEDMALDLHADSGRKPVTAAATAAVDNRGARS
jgi:hypothetical protein